MTSEQAFAVVDQLGGAKSTAYGIEWGPLRVERGGGIAGNGDQWWIRFPGRDHPPIGPFTRPSQLRTALREFTLACIQFGIGLAALVGAREATE